MSKRILDKQPPKFDEFDSAERRVEALFDWARYNWEDVDFNFGRSARALLREALTLAGTQGEVKDIWERLLNALANIGSINNGLIVVHVELEDVETAINSLLSSLDTLKTKCDMFEERIAALEE